MEKPMVTLAHNKTSPAYPPSLAPSCNLKEVWSRELTQVEKLIMVFYYCDELTLNEIGIVLGLSETHVRQIYNRTLKRLKALLPEH